MSAERSAALRRTHLIARLGTRKLVGAGLNTVRNALQKSTRANVSQERACFFSANELLTRNIVARSAADKLDQAGNAAAAAATARSTSSASESG